MHPIATVQGIDLLVPTSWDETTTTQFLELRKLNKDSSAASVISALSGQPLELCKNLTIDEVDAVLEAISYIYEHQLDYNQYKMPGSVECGGVTIPLPIDITKKTIWQREHFEKLLYPEVAKNQGKIEESIREAIAIYFQPYMTGKVFDDEQLGETVKVVGELPITVAYPIAYFFLNECSKSSLKSVNGLKGMVLPPKKDKLE